MVEPLELQMNIIMALRRKFNLSSIKNINSYYSYVRGLVPVALL
jgi:hypothetical protein